MSGPSVVEYARFHGLAIDHTAEDVLAYLTKLTTDFDPIKNDQSLPEPDFSAFEHDLQEPKLQLSRDASTLLVESIKDPGHDIDWNRVLPKRHRIRDLKLEEPLLATDHETDVRSFRKSALRARDVDVLLAQIASDKCPYNDAFKDEWEDIVSSRSLKIVEEQLKQEKVHTTREALVHLSEALRDDSTIQEREEAMIQDLSTLKRSKRPSTPLSPLEEGSRINSPSTTSEFPTGACSQEMEKRYSEDVKRMDRNVSSHTENFSEKTVPEIPVEGAGHDVKKLPVPSLREVRIGGSNNVSRSDLLAGLLDDLVSNSGSSPALHREGRLDWSPFPALLLKTDTNEWIEDTGRAEEAVRPPQGVIKSEKMLWKQPGLRLLDSNDESDDEMEEDIDLGRAMSSPPQSRVPQKRTASNGEVTSRLTATISPTREKMDIDNVPGNTRRSMTSTRPLLPPNALKVSVKPPTWQEKQESSDETAFKESHITKSTFSASGSIATFLDLRGKKFKRTQPPKQACKDEISSDPIRTTQSAGGDLQRSPIIEATGAIVASGTVQVPATPYNKPLQLAQDTRQSVKALIGPRAIVLDTAMLRTQRPLISYLEHHGDGLLTMIFRDLSAGEIGKPGALSDAPDIILNPRTALFCTHFQALNQKNLPGQSKSTKQAMVQSKILKLTQIYDHLFVLVTMPANGDGLLPASQDTIASFTGFCSGQCIQGTRIVSPIWIPGAMPLSATSPNLYSCTWDLLCRQAFPVSDPIRDAPASAGNVLLIHDETLWELFLRKTGLNPMAAQVVFVMLKRPDGHDFQAEQGWGLRRLVQMRPIERLDMFAEILGRRMVERLSMVLATMHN